MMGDVLKEIEKRIINSFMDYIILSALNRDGMCFSGYDMVKYVHLRFRFLPSPGMVYSNIYALERDGLIYGMQEHRRRVYRLTSKGLSLVKEFERVSNNAQKFVAKVFSIGSVQVSQLP